MTEQLPQPTPSGVPEGMVIAGMNPDGTSQYAPAGPKQEMQNFGGYATGVRLTETPGAVFQAGTGAIYRAPAVSGPGPEAGAEVAAVTPAAEAAGEAAMSSTVEPVAEATPADTTQTAFSGRAPSPYFPSKPPSQEQIDRAKQVGGFDLKTNWNRNNTEQI